MLTIPNVKQFMLINNTKYNIKNFFFFFLSLIFLYFFLDLTFTGLKIYAGDDTLRKLMDRMQEISDAAEMAIKEEEAKIALEEAAAAKAALEEAAAIKEAVEAAFKDAVPAEEATFKAEEAAEEAAKVKAEEKAKAEVKAKAKIEKIRLLVEEMENTYYKMDPNRADKLVPIYFDYDGIMATYREWVLDEAENYTKEDFLLVYKRWKNCFVESCRDHAMTQKIILHMEFVVGQGPIIIDKLEVVYFPLMDLSEFLENYEQTLEMYHKKDLWYRYYIFRDFSECLSDQKCEIIVVAVRDFIVNKEDYLTNANLNNVCLKRVIYHKHIIPNGFWGFITSVLRCDYRNFNQEVFFKIIVVFSEEPTADSMPIKQFVELIDKIFPRV